MVMSGELARSDEWERRGNREERKREKEASSKGGRQSPKLV